MSKNKFAVKKGIAAVFGSNQADQVSAEAAQSVESPNSREQTAKSQENLLDDKLALRKESGRTPHRKIKVTYYIDSTCVKALKHLSVELGCDYSSLVEEAIRDVFRKYSKTA